MIIKLTFLTYVRCNQFLEIPSHFSGVVINISDFIRISKSGVKSPVNSITFFFMKLNFSFQSFTLSLDKDFKGAIYITFPSDVLLNNLNIANSAMAVLPLPVGAPINKFSSE